MNAPASIPGSGPALLAPRGRAPAAPVPAPPPNRRCLALALAVLAALTLVVAEVGLFLGIASVSTWFYDLAWGSYLVLADAIVHLRTGESMLLSRPRAFLLLLPWSCAFWLLFEAANFVLQNWYYVDIAPGWWSRGPGMAVSFATVLPAIFETADLLRSFGLGSAARGRPLLPGDRDLRLAAVGGGASLALALLLPRFGFPLIWVATFLLVDPFIARRGGRSLLSTLASGDRGPAIRLLASGLAAGVLWEFWNFWARSKWIYTVPFFEEGKLFEMPVLGFFGFPPFALECFAFARLLVLARLVPEWECGLAGASGFPEPPPSRRREWLGLAAAAAFSIAVIPGVNALTVRSWIPSVRDLSDLTVDLAARLEAAGIREPRDLLAAAGAGRSPAALEAVEPARRESWLREAALMGVRGMGSRGVRWLASVGIRDVSSLAAADETALVSALSSRGSGPAPAPTPPEVRVWLRGARAAPSP